MVNVQGSGGGGAAGLRDRHGRPGDVQRPRPLAGRGLAGNDVRRAAPSRCRRPSPGSPIHDAPLVAVHAQVVAEAVTTTSAVPPPDANAALAGAIVNVQGDRWRAAARRARRPDLIATVDPATTSAPDRVVVAGVGRDRKAQAARTGPARGALDRDPRHRRLRRPGAGRRRRRDDDFAAAAVGREGRGGRGNRERTGRCRRRGARQPPGSP